MPFVAPVALFSAATGGFADGVWVDVKIAAVADVVSLPFFLARSIGGLTTCEELGAEELTATVGWDRTGGSLMPLIAWTSIVKC